MPLYHAPIGRSWIDSISPSYPSKSLILEKFLCLPTLAMVDEEPVILSCREHTKRSKTAILHVPESPTGTVYSPYADGFAAVTVRPRTNRPFKVRNEKV